MDASAYDIEELSTDDLVALLDHAIKPAVPVETFYRILDKVVRAEQKMEDEHATHQAAPRPEKAASATPGP